MDYNSRYGKYLDLINSEISRRMSPSFFEGRESQGLSEMLKAMAYSLENAGKRIRPVLTLEFCRVCGGEPEKALPLALAIEMIHTYSLIHDDLPCMDDDDMRRGKPSNHKVFGYANALLAGDALLTYAFETALTADIGYEKCVKAVSALAQAAGASGMIAGQVNDLANENRQASFEEVTATDRLKTGELIRVSALLGCIAAGASEEQTAAALRYASDIGLAFQIVDDILDVTGTSEMLGKPVGSDANNNKSTYVSLMGLESSAFLANELTEDAKSALGIFENEKDFLATLADRLASRES